MSEPLKIGPIKLSESTTGAVSTGIDLRMDAVSFHLDADTVAEAVATAIAADIREHISRGETPEGKPLGHSRKHVPGVVSGHLRDGIQPARVGEGQWRIVFPDDRQDYVQKLSDTGRPLIVVGPDGERKVAAALEALKQQAWSDDSVAGQIARSLGGG